MCKKCDGGFSNKGDRELKLDGGEIFNYLKNENPKSFLSHIGKSNKSYEQNRIGCHNSLSIYNAPNFISLFSKFSAFSEAIFRKRILLKSVNISKSFLSPTYIFNIFTVEFRFISRLLSFLDFFSSSRISEN